MTDNDIIKALECCSMDYCGDCPLFINEEFGCDVNIEYEALALINRQKAEIEEKQKQIDKLKLEMSYMESPNTIGDRHEMGG